MATYAELLQAANDDGLRQKVMVAVLVAAEVVRTENAQTVNHANRLAWAKSTFQNPEPARDSMVRAILVQNRAVPVATILAADDATVQTAVNNAVDVFAT